MARTGIFKRAYKRNLMQLPHSIHVVYIYNVHAKRSSLNPLGVVKIYETGLNDYIICFNFFAFLIFINACIKRLHQPRVLYYFIILFTNIKLI